MPEVDGAIPSKSFVFFFNLEGIKMVVCSVRCYDEDYNFALYSRQYDNGQIAIEAIDINNNELWGRLTVAVDPKSLEFALGEGEIVVNTWRENRAWAEATCKALPDYFEDTGRRIYLNGATSTAIQGRSDPCFEAQIWKLKLPIPNIAEFDSLKWHTIPECKNISDEDTQETKEKIIEDIEMLWDDLAELSEHVNNDQKPESNYPLEARKLQVASLYAILQKISNKHNELQNIIVP